MLGHEERVERIQNWDLNANLSASDCQSFSNQENLSKLIIIQGGRD